jgi:hypothetical protein
VAKKKVPNRGSALKRSPVATASCRPPRRRAPGLRPARRSPIRKNRNHALMCQCRMARASGSTRAPKPRGSTFVRAVNRTSPPSLRPAPSSYKRTLFDGRNRQAAKLIPMIQNIEAMRFALVGEAWRCPFISRSVSSAICWSASLNLGGDQSPKGTATSTSSLQRSMCKVRGKRPGRFRGSAQFNSSHPCSTECPHHRSSPIPALAVGKTAQHPLPKNGISPSGLSLV